MAFDHIAEMKIKKPAVLGSVCRKLAKYLLKEFDNDVREDESPEKKKFSLKKDEMKC